MSATERNSDCRPRASLNCEQLEPRCTPAGGNVNVFISNGTLFVVGDAADNAVTTRQDQFGNIIIAGVFGTTVNGQQVIMLPPFIPTNAVFAGGFGNDQIDVSGLQVANSLLVSGGPGNDLVTLRDGVMANFITVATHDGNDVLIANNVAARVGMQIDGGPGFDTAMLRNIFAGSFFFHNNFERFV